jgi:hypothetical protein
MATFQEMAVPEALTLAGAAGRWQFLSALLDLEDLVLQ